MAHQYLRKTADEIKEILQDNPTYELFLCMKFITLNLMKVYQLLDEKIKKREGAEQLVLSDEITGFYKEVGRVLFIDAHSSYLVLQ